MGVNQNIGHSIEHPPPIEDQGNLSGREGSSEVIFEGAAMSYVPWVTEDFHMRFPVSVKSLFDDAHEKPLDRSTVDLMEPS